MKNCKIFYRPPRGFTLVETLIYLGLFVLIIVGGFSSIFALQQSSARTRSYALLFEDAAYIGDALEVRIERNQDPIIPTIDDSEQIKDISFIHASSAEDPKHTTFSFTLESVSNPTIPALTVQRTVYTAP